MVIKGVCTVYAYVLLYVPLSHNNALYIHRAKNNVRTTVNFRANDGKDRSNDYTSGHYDRPGEYSALNRLIIYAIVRCPYGAIAAIDRSIVRTCVHIYIYIYIIIIYIYIYIYIVDRCVDARSLA